MRKEVYFGAISGLLLLAFYVGVIYFLNGPSHLLEEFSKYGALILFLAAGFGAQVGLFLYARAKLSEKKLAGQMAATGGISGGSMVACCLHHISDFAPFLGLSGFFLFRGEATPFFLYVGIISNIVGLTAMLAMMQKQGVFPFKRLSQVDWGAARNTLAAFSAIAVFAAASFMWLLPVSAVSDNGGQFILAAQTDNQNNVEVEVAPSFGENAAEFEIEFTTHSVDLGFKVEEIATLLDSQGNKYSPLKWVGSAPGGHHRSGKLLFGPVPKDATFVALKLSGVAGVDREFEWRLK